MPPPRGGLYPCTPHTPRCPCWDGARTGLSGPRPPGPVLWKAPALPRGPRWELQHPAPSRRAGVTTGHCSSRRWCLRHEEARASSPYLSEKVDFKACCFAGLGLPVVQVVSHCQHKLQTQTVVNDWPVTSSVYTAPSPSPSVPLAPAVGSEPHQECSLRERCPRLPSLPCSSRAGLSCGQGLAGSAPLPLSTT